MHLWELQHGDQAGPCLGQRIRDTESQRTRKRGRERDGEREREKRDKDKSESWSQTESREGSEGESSLSQALIMGGRAGAEGSLFEVCGEKHQRERREASRARGRHRRGRPLLGPTWTSQSPPPPCPASSSPPPICSGLARGPATWSPAWGSGSCKSLLPSQHPQGQGKLLASGTAWTREGRASLVAPAAVPSLSPKKYVLASFGPPTFGILR